MTWLPSPWILLLAFGLDLILGDPLLLPHPVRWMGQAIVRLEPWFRRLPFRLAFSGGCLTLILVLGTFALSWVGLSLALKIHPWLAVVLEVVLLFYCLSVRSLLAAARDVGQALRTGGVEQARQEIGMIVGRDVDQLSETGVIQGAVETVAENFVDGVLSPLLYALLGGAPLALAFKMINTLDSMIGYKNPAYRDFGKFAARVDDVANYLPARLSVGIISLASGLLLGRFRPSLQTAIAEGRNHSSPNAGFSEAAFAGALQVKLGGPNRYHGQLVDKPFIGRDFELPDRDAIPKACRLMLLSTLISMVIAWGLLFLL